MKKIIDVGTLNLTKAHIAMVSKALKSNRLSYGPMTTEFEKRFSALHNGQFGVMTNSGTSALQVTINAMKILYGWKDGDEIIIPATTFVATYNVVLHNNLKPVLVDIDWDLNINPAKIEQAITKRTRAIMPVHLLGKPAKMSEIMDIAEKKKLKVIEDSCETMFMKNIGMGDAACFSFYVAHLLVTGVGGMAVTNEPELSDMIRSLIFHGRDNLYLQINDDDLPTKDVIEARFRFNYPGYSDRSTEVEAALGLVELRNYKKMIKKRQENAHYLATKLYGEIDWDDWFLEYYDNHAFMMFPYFHPQRDKLIMWMEMNGITTRTLMPLINQPYIRKTIKYKDYPVSVAILKEGLLFGCHQDLTKKDLNYIIQTIQSFK